MKIIPTLIFFRFIVNFGNIYLINTIDELFELVEEYDLWVGFIMIIMSL